MSPAIAMLQTVGGFTEAELREHSLDWVKQVSDATGQRHRTDKANQLTFMVLAAAAAQGSQEAADQVDEVLAELRGKEDESVAHLTDPNAQTDWEAVAALNGAGAPFGFQRVKKED